MENKLIEKLDDLNIKDTTLLLDKNINLSLDSVTRKRIEKNILKKTGYYGGNNIFKDKMSTILGERFMKRKIALAASVVVIFGLSGGVYGYAKTTPVAYVSMDINPSVELGVNTFDEVISVEAYNEDGQKILEGTNLKDLDIDDAVGTLISNAISDGYINEDGSSSIEITTSTDKEKVANKFNESLKDAADKTLDNNGIEADVETENVELARRDEAKQLGITSGKLNLIQKLQELDPNINIEDYKSSSVKDIQKKTKELKKESVSDGTTTDNNENTNVNEDSTNSVSTKENSNNSSNNNGNSKGQENSNANSNTHSNTNSKKAENSSLNDKEKNIQTTPENKNNGNNLNSQKNDNSNSQDKSNNKEKNKNN